MISSQLPTEETLRSNLRLLARLAIAVLFVFAVGLTTSHATDPKPRHPADILLLNARVHTLNPKQPWAEALAVRGDSIIAIGTTKEVEAYRASKTKVIDAGGRLVLPGFTDCHTHFLDGALSIERVHLDDAKDVAEIQRLVKGYADAHPELPWIRGRGWTYPAVGPTNLPNKKDLDAIIPDRPVYLEAFDGHTWWANSKALQLAGITRDTPNPPGGEIVRDPATGEATGALKEDSADALMLHALPLPSREERIAAYKAGFKEANRAGLVRVHAAGGVGVGISDLMNADLLEDLRKSGDLTIRMYLAYRAEPPTVTPKQMQEIEQARSKYHDDWISAGAVKFFMDGVIESHTAAMLAPYSDDPKLSGSLLWDPATYRKNVADLDKRGIQIFTHAIGDRAIRVTLDAYKDAAKQNGTRDRRHRIEHIEDASAEDISRFGQLGVIASFQPLHAYPNDDTLLVWLRNVGPERGQRAWAWRSIKDGGGVLAFGSDWPIVTLNPWEGIQNAVTRQTVEGNPPEGFVPTERISVEDAIRGYTMGAAIAGHREQKEGSLEKGKLADLIVVDRNLFEIEPPLIGKTEVLLTMVGGKVVYESAAWKSAGSQHKGEAK
jgi:predicted amidohydrolase YtcJ